jgi:Xaa-Pro dipeptidase
MRRREFLRYTGAAGAGLLFPGIETEGLARLTGAPAGLDQGIDPLPASVYRERLGRAQDMMAEYGYSALFSEPATNFTYLTGASFGRSERLIALLMLQSGTPVIVAPGFEVHRVEMAIGSQADVRGWAEQESPFKLVAEVLSAAGPGRIGIEPTTRYGMVHRLQEAMPDWRFADATDLYTGMRIIKSEEELALIRRAVSITETSIAATFASLEAGVTERDVSAYLAQEMADRGARGGGLVQFGPDSAVPHGGPGTRVLEPGMPVLVDAGCRVHGYTSDITRMHYFGDDPGPQYLEVFNTVLSAQTAAYEAGAPGLECQQLDRIARTLISEAGYGEYFTHRLGHGMGMEGHEPPYLVEGNTRTLEPGMVFTIEPGIYIPEQWGVRIEDDFVVREYGLEPLSTRLSLVGSR